VLGGGGRGGGKSTLLLMARAAIARDRRALLVTGEESAAQVKLRAARLGGAERVEILAETDLDAICATLERERPAVPPRRASRSSRTRGSGRASARSTDRTRYTRT
jgi:DNA repair protein RadA/Sms